MQVKLLTRTGTIQDMVSFAAKAAQTTRGNSDKDLFATEQQDLLTRIIKLGHESILEHIYLTYSIKELSRACLQELARHRHIALSVESTRQTLRKNLSHPTSIASEMILEANLFTQAFIDFAQAHPDMPNDILKYYLPEFWPTNLIMSTNVRELRHIINLRTATAALHEFRILANEFFNVIPNEFKFLLQDCVHQEVKSRVQPELDILTRPNSRRTKSRPLNFISWAILSDA